MHAWVVDMVSEGAATLVIIQLTSDAKLLLWCCIFDVSGLLAYVSNYWVAPSSSKQWHV